MIKIKHPVLFFLLFCITISETFSQSADTLETKIKFLPYFKSGFKDAGEILISPLHWKKKEWLTFGATAATTAFLFGQDKKIQNFFQDRRSVALNSVTKYLLEPWGDEYPYQCYTIMSLSLLFLEGFAFDNPKNKKIALLGLKAYYVTGALVYLPKFLGGRHRPYQDNPGDPLLWDGPGFSKHVSFFSGHTAVSFSVATIISLSYKDQTWLPYITYGIASLVGLSRIYDDKHWASDVFTGAVFGYFAGRLIFKHNNLKISLTVNDFDQSLQAGVLIPF
jgi:membrane-associated phospholipid phosphatase